MNQPTLALPIEDMSHVGEARRIASSAGRRMGLSQSDVGEVAIVVTELARNIVLHAGRGVLLLTPRASNQNSGLEILALDKGPGMADVDRCLQDGYSTAGTPGTGLGAVVRLSDFFDIYSAPGKGTVILCRIWRGPAPDVPRIDSGPIIGAVSVPVRGEEVCGDGWAAHVDREPWRILVADGLGHGPSAAEASRQMLAVFEAERNRGLVAVLERGNGTLRATRGAAVSIAELDAVARQVRYAGVGNIAGTIIIPGGKHINMVSHNGTIGVEARRIHEFTYDWPPGALLVMHSDGISTHWSLEPYPGLIARHPSLTAAVLWRDFRRERDDATIVVAREKGYVHASGYTQY